MKRSSTTLSSLVSRINSSSFSGTHRQTWSDGTKLLAGIAFGRPSSLPKNATSSSSTPSLGKDLQKLATQVASGGLTNAFGKSAGPGYLAGFGLSPVISGIAGLFGLGKKETLPPLQLFQLPDPIAQTFHLNSSTTQAARGSLSPNVQVNLQTPNSSLLLDHSNEIAKAVKKAILNSHSLNDVISEL